MTRVPAWRQDYQIGSTQLAMIYMCAQPATSQPATRNIRDQPSAPLYTAVMSSMATSLEYPIKLGSNLTRNTKYDINITFKGLFTWRLLPLTISETVMGYPLPGGYTTKQPEYSEPMQNLQTTAVLHNFCILQFVLQTKV